MWEMKLTRLQSITSLTSCLFINLNLKKSFVMSSFKTYFVHLSNFINFWTLINLRHPRRFCETKKKELKRVKRKDSKYWTHSTKRHGTQNTYSIEIENERIVNYLFQMFVDPFCESFLLDCIAFICWGEKGERISQKRKNCISSVFFCFRWEGE